MLNGCGNTAGRSGINARPPVLPRCWRWMVANRCRAILIFRLHQKFCKARGCGSAMHHLAIRCRAVGFQAETFAKPVTDGALAARRHFDKSVMRCLINVGDEPSPLHFRFQAALIRHHTRAIIIGSLKTGKLVFRLPIGIQRAGWLCLTPYASRSTRCRRVSAITMPADTEMFMLSTVPNMGMDTSASQCSRVSRRMPSPSLPITQATFSGMS